MSSAVLSFCLRRLLLAAALLLPLAPLAATAQDKPVARNGQLDLSKWEFERDGIVVLDGQWDFFWQRLVQPGDPAAAPATTDVPSHWSAPGGNGFATYRLTIACRRGTGLAVSLPMQHSAVTLYVNGAVVARQGQTADSPQSYRPGVTQQIVPLDAQTCPLQITAHVSNYDMFRGGMVRSIQLGTEQQLAQRRELALTRNLVALGGVLALALLALVFYSWRRHDRTPLYFGLFCLSLSISLGLSGERALEGLVLALGFENHIRLLFINWFAGLALFPLFLQCLYPRDTPAWAIRATVVFSLAGASLAALTPVRVFSYSGPALQAGALAVAIGMALVLVKAWRRGNRQAAIMLAGLAVIVATIAHDVVFFRHLLSVSLLPYGMLGFVLAPAVLLAQRFARALRSEELRGLEQRERADLLVRSTKAGVLDWNATSNETKYSERYLEMLGYDGASEPPGFRELVHPEDHDRVHASFLAQLRDRSVRSGVRAGEPMDYRMRRRDGAVIWVHAEAISVCAADGRMLRYICSFIDITQQKHLESELKDRIREKDAAEHALSLERDRLRLLVSATKAGFGDWDAVTDKVTYGGRLKEMLGWPPDADTADWPSIFEMMHPDDQERARGEFREMIRRATGPGEGEPGKPMSYRLRRADGSYIWIHAEGISQRDEQGRTRRFITSYLDVTAFREQEEELRRTAHELQDQMKFINDLVDALPLALAMRDPQGRYVFANRTWERYHGRKREDVIGTTLDDQLDTEELASIRALDAEAVARGPDHPLYTEAAPFRGREHTQTRTVMLNARKEPLGVVVASEDVTERRVAERALALEQKRMELVVRGARVGIVDWDGVTHETYYSPRFREIRGYAPDADTSDWPDYFKVMIHPDDRDRVIRRWVPFIKGKGPEGPLGEYYSPEEYRLLRADGSYVWVQVGGMAVRDGKRFVVRWIAAIIDITERRAQQAELEIRNEALKENVRLREEVERISRHDIKTPLNSIVAVPRLLREERKLGPEADELLGIVERAGYRILSMVNLSLDLYKMEQGSYAFRPDAVDLRDLLQKVMADIRMHAASKRVQLVVEIGDTGYAWAEELLCYSLLANLLKNAVEASPEAERVTVTAQAAEPGGILLRIHNMGVVPQEIRASFFQKYATLGKASGTGLGTYSARLMARVQDGDIEMTTSDDDGTTLSVRLRAAPEGAVPATVRHAADRQRIEPLQISSMPPTRVLLVDDDEYNLLIVRHFLPSPPFTVDTAINGKVALASADLQWPDIIFMDLDMPVMGGLQAVQELRAMERHMKRPRCTIVALSSHDDDETRERSLQAGFDRYLTKPVTRDIIHEVLLAQSPGTADVAAPAPARHAAGPLDPVFADPDVAAVLDEFIASRRILIDAMAASSENRGEVRRIAHQLAGSFGLYGFHWASDQSRWIEHNSADVDSVRVGQMAGELRAHLDSVEIRFSPEIQPSESST